jgi:hypothetical protein
MHDIYWVNLLLEVTSLNTVSAVTLSSPFLIPLWTSLSSQFRSLSYSLSAFLYILYILTHLYTPLTTTCNYSAVADLHTLQTTKAPVKPFSSLLSFWQPFPTTLLLSSEYPATELFFTTGLSTVSWTGSPSLLSLRCRAQLNCQPSTNWVPGWQPFHTNLLVFSLEADIQLATDSWTGQLSCLQDNFSVQTTSKTLFFYCCTCICFCWNVFTELSLRNGLHNPVVVVWMYVAGVT